VSSQILEIRRTPEGKIQARRKDGRPLTPKDKEEAKRLAAQLPTAQAVTSPKALSSPSKSARTSCRLISGLPLMTALTPVMVRPSFMPMSCPFWRPKTRRHYAIFIKTSWYFQGRGRGNERTRPTRAVHQGHVGFGRGQGRGLDSLGVDR
jgi:broad specificity phosphatase PhoE